MDEGQGGAAGLPYGASPVVAEAVVLCWMAQGAWAAATAAGVRAVACCVAVAATAAVAAVVAATVHIARFRRGHASRR